MNYKSLLTYTFEYLQPKIVQCMKQATNRYVNQSKNRIYTDLILYPRPFATPVHFIFNNYFDRIEIKSKIHDAFVIEKMPILDPEVTTGLTYPNGVVDHGRLVRKIIQDNAHAICLETMKKELPDLTINRVYGFDYDDIKILEKNGEMLRFSVKVTD